ncbi:butyrophilin subfamily 1 member A1-like [Spea bombifrons]|uniref:butyrophilin subfamily 1 member A1-like n=1 Tax=Spea bombifrons TaxID=233779 RepID=UPI00234B42E0|nr:butyrophilin subfamily 1 member A1-like [Spea bombifrons]
MQRLFGILVCITVVLPTTAAVVFRVLSHDTLLVAEVGSDVVLPCTLSPPLSPVGLEVRWFHNLYHSVVFLMKDGKEDRQQQSAEYRGRAYLQAGPDAGNLSLSLRNVRLSDAGKYHCFVENTSSYSYEEAVMELRVVGLGSAPLVEVTHQDSSVLLSCSSDGWFPKPQMRWEKESRDVATEVQHMNRSDGLLSVKSNILLKDSSEGLVYCGVRHSITGLEKGVYVKISEDMFPRLSFWAVLFLLLLAILIAGSGTAAWYFYTYRKAQERKTAEYEKKQERLIQEIGECPNTQNKTSVVMNIFSIIYFFPHYFTLFLFPEWRKISAIKEPILFNSESAFPGLLVSPDCRCISPTGNLQTELNDERFDTEPCVLGIPLFDSGVHYWETEIREQGSKFWSVGVAKQSVRRTGGLRESPEAGIWAMRSSEDGFYLLKDVAEKIHPSETPRILGTYLNFEGGEVAFYNAETFECLCRFRENFAEPVCAFYYVGSGITFLLNPEEPAIPFIAQQQLQGFHEPDLVNEDVL